MTAVTTDIKQSAAQANALVRQIGQVRRNRVRKSDALDARIQKLKDRYGPEIEQLKQDEQRLIEELVQLVVPRFALLARRGTRTIYLRSGEIQLRQASLESLLIAEGETEDAVIKRIARLRGLNRFTSVGKRTLKKAALKKEPSFVARVKGLSIGRKTSLIIKPAKYQGEEIVQELNPLSVTVATEET